MEDYVEDLFFWVLLCCSGCPAYSVVERTCIRKGLHNKAQGWGTTYSWLLRICYSPVFQIVKDLVCDERKCLQRLGKLQSVEIGFFQNETKADGSTGECAEILRPFP